MVFVCGLGLTCKFAHHTARQPASPTSMDLPTFLFIDRYLPRGAVLAASRYRITEISRYPQSAYSLCRLI